MNQCFGAEWCVEMSLFLQSRLGEFRQIMGESDHSGEGHGWHGWHEYPTIGLRFGVLLSDIICHAWLHEIS